MIEKYTSNSVYTAQQPKNNENSVTKVSEPAANPLIEGDKPVDPASKEKERKDLESLINSMNEFIQPAHTSLKFQLHDKLEEYYVQVINDDTKEVIREIPSEKMLDIYAAMKEYLGLMVDEKI
ncbi:flagellar protein FlaG [Niallia taxi]|uniref:flagellar protein FlaG n=1 Tax=Niallia taxi TaxID=2499688 RepID=UPI003981A2D6